MIHIKKRLVAGAGLVGLLVPVLAFAQAPAQGQSIDRLGTFLQQFIGLIDNYLVPLLFAVAFIVFIFGIFQYFIAGGADEEKRSKGKSFMLWGMIGFFVMVSIWGILNLLVYSFGFGSDTRPALPTFNPAGSSPSGSSGSAFPAAAQNTSNNPTNTSKNTGTNSGGSAPTNTVQGTQQAPVNKCSPDTVCSTGLVCNPFSGVCDLPSV